MSSQAPNNQSGNESVVIAMSGGVDSSVAALLLQEAGASLVGLFMKNGVKVPDDEVQKKSCCSSADARDARMVAAKLGIPFQAVDLGPEFQDLINFFTGEYTRGRTPNPCALCNRDLKFGRLLEFADTLGCTAVATGHYARLELVDGRPVVRRGVDRAKDQSYQLFCVAERDLARTRLPLGDLEKPEVRAIAEANGIRTAKKPDSQEICFVPSNDYRKLLDERGVERHPGNFVDRRGKVLGKHDGTEHFTIGQRRGHGIGGGVPLYVIATRPAVGEVVLGPREQCFSTGLIATEANWIGIDPPAPGAPMRALVQVRYHHDAEPCTVSVLPEGRLEIVFDEPVSAVAPGQGAALYLEDRLIGGGWIESATAVEPEGSVREASSTPAGGR